MPTVFRERCAKCQVGQGRQCKCRKPMSAGAQMAILFAAYAAAVLVLVGIAVSRWLP